MPALHTDVIMHLTLLASLITFASARPSFIAVPADQIAFVDLSSLHVRVPRQTLEPPPAPLPKAVYEDEYEPQPIPIQTFERQQYLQQFQPQQLQQLQPQQIKQLQPQQIKQLQPQQLQQQRYQHDEQFQPQQYQQQPIGLAPPPPPQPAPARIQVQEPNVASEAVALEPAAKFAERPPDFGEYVDFGAHTGDHGAFGWYADYPVNNHQDESSF